MRPHFKWMHRHLVCVYVCTKMLVFFKLQIMCNFYPRFARNSQLKDVQSFGLLVYNNNVWFQCCNCDIRRKGPSTLRLVALNVSVAGI